MTYTNGLLLLLGIIGILLHNMIKLNELNKKSPGKVRFREYLATEKYSIGISLLVVFAGLLLKHEIRTLELAGKWLGLGFLAMGYMGQSIVVSVMGRANKVIDGNK